MATRRSETRHHILAPPRFRPARIYNTDPIEDSLHQEAFERRRRLERLAIAKFLNIPIHTEEEMKAIEDAINKDDERKAMNWSWKEEARRKAERHAAMEKEKNIPDPTAKVVPPKSQDDEAGWIVVDEHTLSRVSALSVEDIPADATSNLVDNSSRFDQPVRSLGLEPDIDTFRTTTTYAGLTPTASRGDRVN
ncbi:hypothetical protein BJ508DRAFT_303968 [Ascobolus immersus RN42]|uniref:Uncharacterized protein n=1 Tax=Ascobolus immersus RN42 TaxID=1160509 RepID=A0A3N4IHH7_ASCIM|nr:hypothetical protein BJ508DRAFT_303968 [Ascobolus immersus RN42]